MTDTRSLEFTHAFDVRYGENAWMESAGVFANPNNNNPLAITRFDQIEGAALSATNIFDLSRLNQTITHVVAAFQANGHETGAVAIAGKHGNACGASVSKYPITATTRALDGDPVSVFGGEFVTNYELSEHDAEVMLHYGIEGDTRRGILDILAVPGVGPGVVDSIKRKDGKLRILVNPALAQLSPESLDTTEQWRYLTGGDALFQQNYTFVPDFHSDAWVRRNGELDPSLERDLLLAWAIGSTSSSNTITGTRDSMLLANAVGQQSRVRAVKLAQMIAADAHHTLEGAAFYSDSFFPFPDAPALIADMGARAILVSSGSVMDKAVFDEFERRGVQAVTAPDVEIRGFYGHG